MNIGGLHLGVMEILLPLLLLLVLLWMVLRVKSRGKESSPDITERATHELYEEEQRRHEDDR